MATKPSRPQGARKSASKASKKATKTVGSAKTSSAVRAGKPTMSGSAVPALADTPATRPTDEELDMRDQMKSGPRRPAGPPLEGDHPEAVPTARLTDESMSDPTDPA